MGVKAVKNVFYSCPVYNCNCTSKRGHFARLSTACKEDGQSKPFSGRRLTAMNPSQPSANRFVESTLSSKGSKVSAFAGRVHVRSCCQHRTRFKRHQNHQNHEQQIATAQKNSVLSLLLVLELANLCKFKLFHVKQVQYIQLSCMMAAGVPRDPTSG